MEYVAFIASVAVMAYIMYRQQRTIDRLTDKLMAKDYREYVSLQPQPEKPHVPNRKPQSWYDDPDIPDDEIQ